MEIHVALVISYRPIDLSLVEADTEGVQHLVVEKFDIDNFKSGSGGFSLDVRPSAQYSRDPHPPEVHGRGTSVSVVVTDWLNQLVSSMWYLPFYKRK